jgi:hypothetical protein
MAEDKKNPKEASNIFHSIMKASVKPEKVKCPVYGVNAKQIKGNEFECSNRHKFTQQ